MAGNPQIAQGTLNRIRGSVVIPNLPALNITAPDLSPQGISIAFEGEATGQLPTMTGTVTSGAPYQMVTVTIALLKTQSLSQAWEAQRQTLSTIGDITVTPDASTLSPYLFNNCSIDNVSPLTFAGVDASYILTLKGYYQINADLWSLV